MEMKQYQVIFSGRVQGVGFRYTALYLAKNFKHLTGYVRNLADGRVECVVEADEPAFKEFLKSIHESSLGRWIADTKITSHSIENRSFQSFDIHV